MGHLFDYLVIIPNWRNSNVEGITKFREFFIVADPGAFFMIFVMAPILFALICFFSYFKSEKRLKMMLGIYLVIALGAFIFTMVYFSLSGYITSHIKIRV